MHPLVRPVAIGRPSFLGAPRCTALELLDADIAILGMPFTTPNDLAGSRCLSSDAPDAVRRQSERLAGALSHYDFDFGGTLFAGQNVRIADCGDVWGAPGAFDANSRAGTRVVETIREAGALPIVLGGDHAAIVPTLHAYADCRSLCVVYLGAELRRVSDLAPVTSIVHVGLRGVGSARQQDVDAAVAFGSQLVRAEDLHQSGVEAVLRRVPPAAAYFICLNLDALDPSIAPGVDLPSFGGLTYYEASKLLIGLAARGPVVGLAVLGIVPSHDLNDITSLLAARLTLNVLGGMARAGLRPPEAAELRAQVRVQA